MKTSQITFLGLALFLVLQFAEGHHHRASCGLGAGSDACGCSEVVVKAAKPIRPAKYAEPYVIQEATAARIPARGAGCGSLRPPRPHGGPSVTDLLRPSFGPVAPRFRPVGDLCSCTSSVTEVVPAYPGKPVCRVGAQIPVYEAVDEEAPCYSGNTQTKSTSTVFSGSSSANAELNAFEDDCLSFDEQENIYNSQSVPAAPADAVSLSLAYGLARQVSKSVPEGRLAFGPKSVPIDGSVTKTQVDIPEERLITIEKPVVELQFTPRSCNSPTYDELIAEQEALEQRRIELEAEAETNQGPAPAFISYSDLGYAPVTSKGNNFVNTVVEGSAVTETDDEPACGYLGPAIPGYRSGNVIVRSEKRQESEQDYYGEDSYEQESAEEQDASYSAEESESYSGSSGSSGLLARLRASARAQNRGGCGCGH